MTEPEPVILLPDPSEKEIHEPDDDTPFTDVKRRRKRNRSGASTSSENTIVSVALVFYELTVVLNPIDPKRLITKLNPIILFEYLESVAPTELFR